MKQTKKGNNNDTNLEKLFPIVLVENDIAVNQQGDISLYYKLDLPEIYSPSRQDYINMRTMLSRGMASLPIGTTIQKLDFFYKGYYTPQIKNAFVLSANETYFAERPIMNHLSYLIVTFTVNDKKRSPNTLTAAAYNAAKIVDKRIFDAEQLSNTFVEIIRATNLIDIQRLTTDDIIELLYRYTTLDFSGKVDSVSANIKADTNGMTIGSQILNVAKAYDFPDKLYSSYPIKGSEVDASMTHNLCLGFYSNHIVSQTIKILDTAAELKRMQQRVKDCDLFSTIENQQIADSITDSITEITKTRQSLVEVDYSIILFDLDRAKVKQAMDNIVGLATSLDFKCNNPAYLTQIIFFNNVPGNVANNYDMTIMPIDLATCLFNLETSSQQYGAGGIILCDRMTGTPTEIDLWHGSLENKNICAVAPSGSGKSFLVNYITHQEYYQGVHVVCIDIGGSYKRNCQSLGGAYIEYSLENPIKLNPFIIENVKSDTLGIPEDGQTDSTNVLFLKSMIFKIWGENKKTPEASQVMSDIIIEYYKHCFSNKQILCFKTFYEYLPIYRDKKFDTTYAKYFDFDSLILVLRSFYDGQYAKILGSTENINLTDNRFIVFELRDIKDNEEVLGVVMHIIIETILEKFRKLKGVRKRVWIDEAWVTLKGAHSDFIEYLFRTCRKSNAGTGIITQGAAEIKEAGAVGKAIVNNCSTTFILDHSKNQQSIPDLQEMFGLTPHQIKLINTIQNPGDNSYKQVFIKLNNTCKVYRVEVSKEARYVFTSKEEEIIEIEKYADIYGGNISNMVKAYIEEKNLQEPI